MGRALCDSVGNTCDTADAPLAEDGQDHRHGGGGDSAAQPHGQRDRAGRQLLVEQPRTDDDQVSGADDQGNGQDNGGRATLERDLEQAHAGRRGYEHRVQVRRREGRGEQRAAGVWRRE
jgi:hypothetical protein